MDDFQNDQKTASKSYLGWPQTLAWATCLIATQDNPLVRSIRFGIAGNQCGQEVMILRVDGKITKRPRHPPVIVILTNQ